MKRIITAILCAFITLTFALVACDPVPGRTLSENEKKADMMWLFSIFGANYAPARYKEERYGFKIDELNQKYLTEAANTKSNEEFYLLMERYVAEFHDAHTSLKLTPSNLPGRAKIAFLGITGQRSGNAYWVKELLPTLDKTLYPIKAGDIITHIDGVPVFQYIDKYLTPYRNFGSEEANHTLLMGQLFTRLSISNPMPAKPNVELTVQRGAVATKVIVPWIVQDLTDFQADLSRAQTPSPAQSKDKLPKKTVMTIKVKDPLSGEIAEIALTDQNGNVLTAKDLKEMFDSTHGDFADSFKFSMIGGWTANPKKISDSEDVSGFEKLKQERYVPENAVPLPDAELFPAYIYSEKIKTPSGKETSRSKPIGYIRIADFSPPSLVIKNGAPVQLDPLAEFKKTLSLMEQFGVKDLVIDTMDNPGGNLFLGMAMAQALSNEPIKLPGVQFGLDDNWLDQMQANTLKGTSETREIFRRVYEQLKAERAQGKTISSTFSLESLYPFQTKPNSELKRKFNIKVLVSESNASCGDIFPMMVQENGLAQIVGTKTMGAGGNVVEFNQAPNSHADVRQTRSLIVKKDGTYLENNGVVPDMQVDFKQNMAATRGNYMAAIRYVTDLIMKRTPMEPTSPAFLKLVEEQHLKKIRERMAREETAPSDKKFQGALCENELSQLKK